MKIKIKVEKQVDIKAVKVILPVLYGEEDMPLDFPLREEDSWSALIEVDTGKILDWPQGREGSFYMKVCDGGMYELFDSSFNSVAKIDNNYVPNELIPGEYGDYVDFKINKEGFINNWPKNPDLSQFFPEDQNN